MPVLLHDARNSLFLFASSDEFLYTTETGWFLYTYCKKSAYTAAAECIALHRLFGLLFAIFNGNLFIHKIKLNEENVIIII